MKWPRFIFSSVVWLCTIFSVLAQEVRTTTKTYDIGPYCVDEIFRLGNRFSSTYQKHGNCGYSLLEHKDRSSEIEVSGAEVFEEITSLELPGAIPPEIIKLMDFSFKAKEGDKQIIVKCRTTVETYVAPGCPLPHPVDYIDERIYIYNFKVIPTPPTPTLDLERYISPYVINLEAKGCPTDNDAVEYLWYEAGCPEENNAVLIKRTKFEKYLGAGGVSYRVACSDNYGRCIGKPSDFVRGITYNPPTNDCIPDNISDQISKIENIQKSDNSNYHQFPGKTEICDASIDASCTVKNVFDLMVSRNKYITPTPSDTWMLTRPFKDSSYPEMDFPVKQCKVIDLPGLVGETQLKDGASIITLPISLTDNHRNPVMTYIDNSNYVTINYTLNDHIFSPGRVIRKVIMMCNKVYVLTIGEGSSDAEHDWAVAWINKNLGKSAFEKIDQRLKLKYQEEYHQ